MASSSLSPEDLLASPSFSVSDYLNTALQDTVDDDDTERRTVVMAELALQLQLQTQSCHEDIGRISAELHALLPRCVSDISRIGKGLESLQMDIADTCSSSSMVMQQQQGQGGQQGGQSSSLETLGTLHALQVNLTRTQEILTAAASWDTTLTNVSVSLSSQNVVAAVRLWKQLESGELALRGMPQVQERQQALQKIRTQLLQLLQPQLQHALQNMTTRLAPLQQVTSLYKQLGTSSMEKLVTEYVKIRPTRVHKLWFDFKPSIPTSGNATSPSSPSSSSSMSCSFLEWLPSWLDAVLSLVSEERRQSQSIFGPTFVPEITIKVLSECFRPILPSFKSRLESICSSQATTGGGTTNTASTLDSSAAALSSLENLCAVYENTLQFLALVYEAIAGAWLDMVDASVISTSSSNSLPNTTTTTTTTTTGTTSTAAPAITDLLLYQELTAIFLQVTGPFRSYQEHLSRLEQMYAGRAVQQIGNDMQRKITNENNTDLQQAVEQLQTSALLVFPIAQGAVARFELLNGGFGTAQALGVIDNQLLSRHADMLALAVRSLQTEQSQQDNNNSTSFDESHVFAALQVLQMAGSFTCDLAALQDKTRERLVLLHERMAAHMVREQQVQQQQQQQAQQADDSTTTITRSSQHQPRFVLPESLSAVEIDSIVTKAVCGSLLGSNEFNMDVASGGCIFPNSKQAVRRLAQSCHAFVFDVCSAVPRRHLQSVSSLAAWKEQPPSRGGGGGGNNNASLSYGTLPQGYITSVGEHMLALVQALEPFASDRKALAMANHVMEGVRDAAVAPWRELVVVAAASDNADDSVVRSLMDGKEIAHLVVSSAAMEEEEEEAEVPEDGEDETERASTAFCNSWLDVVGLAVTGRLLERIMRIPSLTAKGCEHLNADLSYLVNVLAALGVAGHPHPLIGHVAELAVLDGNALAERIASRNRQNRLEAALAAMEERLAAIRGVAAHYNY